MRQSASAGGPDGSPPPRARLTPLPPQVVANGAVSDLAAARLYVGCTLLATSLHGEEESGRQVEECVASCLDFLLERDLVQREGSGEDARLRPTHLGCAVLASALGPDEGLAVFCELEKARRCVALDTDLHLVYLTTPVYLDVGGTLDWYRYLDLMEELPAPERRVATLVGVEERFLMRCARGQPSRTDRERAQMRLHRRFYSAMVLHQLVRECSLPEVTRKFGVNKGQLQSLQQAAATYAGMVSVFCDRLGWTHLQQLLSSFQSRLIFGVQRELVDLVRVDLVNARRARALHRAGFQTVSLLATARPQDVEKVLRQTIPFECRQAEDEADEEEDEEGSARRGILAPDGRPLTEEEAALYIVAEARRLLQEDLAALGVVWNPGDVSQLSQAERVDCRPNLSSSQSLANSVTAGSCPMATPSASQSLRATPGISQPLRATPGFSQPLRATPGISQPLRATPGFSQPLRATPGISQPLRAATPSVSSQPLRATPGVSSQPLRTTPGVSSQPLRTTPSVSSQPLRATPRASSQPSGATPEPPGSTPSAPGSLRRSLETIERIGALLRRSIDASRESGADSESPEPLVPGAESHLASPSLFPEDESFLDSMTDALLRGSAAPADPPTVPARRSREPEPGADDDVFHDLLDHSWRSFTAPHDPDVAVSTPPGPGAASTPGAGAEAGTGVLLTSETNAGSASTPAAGKQAQAGVFLTPGASATTAATPGAGPRAVAASTPGAGTRSVAASTPMARKLMATNSTPGAKTRTDEFLTPDVSAVAASTPRTMAVAATNGGVGKRPRSVAASTPVVGKRAVTVSTPGAEARADEFLAPDVSAVAASTPEAVAIAATDGNGSGGKKPRLAAAVECSDEDLFPTTQQEEATSATAAAAKEKEEEGARVMAALTAAVKAGKEVSLSLATEYGSGYEDAERPVGLAVTWSDEEVLYFDVRDDLGRLRALVDLMEGCGRARRAWSGLWLGRDMQRLCRALLRHVGRAPSARVPLVDPLLALWMADPDAPPDVDVAAACARLCPGPGPAPPLADTRRRCEAEAAMVLRLWGSVAARLKERGLLEPFRLVEMPTQALLGKCEAGGFLLDARAAAAERDGLVELMRNVEAAAYRLAGRHFDLGSPRDVAQVLFAELRLPVASSRRPGRKGTVHSTSRAVLRPLAAMHPLPGLVIDWRRMETVLTRSARPLAGAARRGERVCGRYAVQSATGRISMSAPNLQSLPKRFQVAVEGAETEVNLRRCLRAGPGRRLLALDYSQLELRLLAHLSADERLRQFLSADGDVFRAIAAGWRDKEEAAVSDEERQQAKQICYGVVYGMGAAALGEEMGVDAAQAEQFIAMFLRTYPGLQRFITKTVERCRRLGFVTTIFGRRRYLGAIADKRLHTRSHAERQAVNSTIQGSAADIAKKAMLEIDQSLCNRFPCAAHSAAVCPDACQAHGDAKRKGGAFLLLHLHDELIYEVEVDQFESIASLIRRKMENTVQLSVPLPVRMKAGDSWGEMEAWS